MSKEPKPRVLTKTWSEVRLAGKLGSDAQPPTAVTPEPTLSGWGIWGVIFSCVFLNHHAAIWL